MADLSLEWDSGDSPDAVQRDLRRFEREVRRNLKEAMETWVLMVEGTAKEIVAVDTGRLRASISSAVRQEGRNILKGYIGSNVTYAPFVERGTRYQEAQPYLAPAIEAHIGDAERLFEQAIEDAARAVR